MLVNTIKKTMKTALKTFADLEQKQPTSIEVVIHTKTDDLLPKYFYMIDNKPKREDDGSVKTVTFTEMLNKKFDLLNREFLAAQFLPSWFKTTGEVEKVNPKNLYVRIGTHSNDIDKLSIQLNNNSEKLKDLKLEDIFAQ
tara:strand:+ start:6681 stop:7100 length:420 start_codon:yes stop_codon:yes gene_type:complete